MNLVHNCFSIFKICSLMLLFLHQGTTQLREWKEIPCDGIYKPANCENASIDTLLTIEDYERCAPAVLETLTRDYVWGSAGQGKTFFENKEAFKRMWIKKKVLKNITAHILETYIFGRKIAVPLGISPTVGQWIVHPDGERGTARGAASVGAAYILNVWANTSLEDVAASVPKDTELWMQTYIFAKRDLVVGIVRRAEKAGYKAIVVTVDQPTGFEISCNSLRRTYDVYETVIPNIGPHEPEDIDYYGTVTPAELKWLAGITELPIIAKGVQSGDDALEAAKAGARGILVSNQGGRQLDDALPTIDSLLDVVSAVKSRYPDVEVFVDGGIRTGHDVFKALARGAKMAFVGRPPIWGLAMGGEKGVKKVLSILRDEFEDALIRAGFSSPSSISPSSIVSQWIYSDYKQKEL